MKKILNVRVGVTVCLLLIIVALGMCLSCRVTDEAPERTIAVQDDDDQDDDDQDDDDQDDDDQDDDSTWPDDWDLTNLCMVDWKQKDVYLDPSGLCPPNFALVLPEHDFEAVRTGDRWGPEREKRYKPQLESFCLSIYEASQPMATSTFRGDYCEDGGHHYQLVPPAQVCKGVLPWNSVSWHETTSACQQQGWRLPTFEELQCAMTGGNPDNIWGFGGSQDPETGQLVPPGEWNCRLSELSWFETCEGPRDYEYDEDGQTINQTRITGGPFGTSNYLGKCHNLLGNVAEWTATPWDPQCYGTFRFSLFGQSLHGQGPDWENRHNPDPDLPGCWRMGDYGEGAYAEHEHDWHPNFPPDDGFRCAATPSPDWLEKWETKLTQPPGFSPHEQCFYDCQEGRERCYSVPRNPDQDSPHLLD